MGFLRLMPRDTTSTVAGARTVALCMAVINASKASVNRLEFFNKI